MALCVLNTVDTFHSEADWVFLVVLLVEYNYLYNLLNTVEEPLIQETNNTILYLKRPTVMFIQLKYAFFTQKPNITVHFDKQMYCNLRDKNDVQSITANDSTSKVKLSLSLDFTN
jgi:hypothetical protein